MHDTDFWRTLDEWAATAELVIDRPRGSRHPRYPDFVYPVDYGYWKGLAGGDGQDLDVWRGEAAGRGVVAIVCTADRIKRDAELKILLDCTPAEIEQIRAVHNHAGFMAGLLVKR